MKKWLAKGLDKLLWVVAGGVIMTLITIWIKDTSPDIVVRQFYNTIEITKPVPKRVGELILDYQPESKQLQSIYIVDVRNEGRGPEESLRLHVKFPNEARISFHEKPDFRVYKVEAVSLSTDTFFMSLGQFPKQAHAPVSFNVGPDKTSLCEVRIKVAGREKEGRIEAIKGIECGI